MFRVVSDQLRISEGWVRCGQCDEVFDANAHLKSHGPAPEPIPLPVDTAQDVLVDARTPDELLREDHPSEFARQESRVPDSAPDTLDDWVHQTPLDTPKQTETAAAKTDAEEVPSFMSRTPNPSRFGRYLGAKVMGSVCLLLALFLALQYVMQERDRLAARAPALRPVFTASCVFLGCALSAPLQIDAISIESSAFTRISSGVYNLRWSLRNTAAIGLSAPALELTLTDMQDHALVRRVLLPADYSGTQLIAAGAELLASVSITVQASSASEKIAGYKLLAFYP